MTGLQIAEHRTLPLDLALSSIADFGQRGTGKTFTAGVLVEDMLGAGVQVVVIDPTDVWWGLRSSADGKSEGYTLYRFGGEHGDAPLEEGEASAEAIADMLVDTRASAILSLRHLRKGKQHEFFRAFAERIYHRKGEPGKRTPVHIVIDEAHSFAPSTVTVDTARMVGAVEDLVRLGRSSGIGVSLISQRPKAVNANVRTQAETLICHRLLDSLDRKAVKEWVDAHDEAGRAAEFMTSLGGLKRGEAWVWAPPLDDLFERIQVRAKRTWDSSATPKIGEEPREPTVAAAVDVEALGAQLGAAVERAQANDPKVLRARIAELQREVGTLRAADYEALRDNGEVDALRAENDVLRSTVAAYRLAGEEARRRLGDLEAEVGGVWGLLNSALTDVPAVPRWQRRCAPLVPPTRTEEQPQAHEDGGWVEGVEA